MKKKIISSTVCYESVYNPSAVETLPVKTLGSRRSFPFSFMPSIFLILTNQAKRSTLWCPFLSLATHPGRRFTGTCLDFKTVSHFLNRLITPFKLCGAAVARFHGWAWRCVTMCQDKHGGQAQYSYVAELLALFIIFKRRGNNIPSKLNLCN